MSMKLEIDSKNTLLSTYRPLNPLFIGVVIIAGIFSILFTYISTGSLIFLIFTIFVVTTVNYLFSRLERELKCSINKTTGTVSYRRGGVFGSQYNAQRIECRLVDIMGIEVRRYIRNRGDKFQIRLVLTDGRLLPLSRDELSFSDCQFYTEEIRKFLGADIPVATSDGWLW